MNFQGRTSETDPLKVTRIRLADVTGWRRVEGSEEELPWAGDLMG